MPDFVSSLDITNCDMSIRLHNKSDIVCLAYSNASLGALKKIIKMVSEYNYWVSLNKHLSLSISLSPLYLYNIFIYTSFPLSPPPLSPLSLSPLLSLSIVFLMYYNYNNHFPWRRHALKFFHMGLLYMCAVYGSVIVYNTFLWESFLDMFR